GTLFAALPLLEGPLRRGAFNSIFSLGGRNTCLAEHHHWQRSSDCFWGRALPLLRRGQPSRYRISGPSRFLAPRSVSKAKTWLAPSMTLFSTTMGTSII